MGHTLKNSEKNITKAIKGMLALMEAAGQIVHHDRLNAGCTFGLFDKRGKQRAINMCRPGSRIIMLS